MKQHNEREVSDGKAARGVVNYFSLFQYAPSDKEIISYFPYKRSKAHIKRILNEFVREKKLISLKTHMPPGCIYTIPGHSIYFRNRIVRKAYSEKKLRHASRYFKILYMCPLIKLVGVSGSCAMHNAKIHDDVDIFVVTAAKRLWLGRLWALFLAEVMRLRRRRGDVRVAGKVCLN